MTRNLATLKQIAEEFDVSYGRARMWACEPTFPAPADDTRRPHLYDIDRVDAWHQRRPGKGTRTDLQKTRAQVAAERAAQK